MYLLFRVSPVVEGLERQIRLVFLDPPKKEDKKNKKRRTKEEQKKNKEEHKRREKGTKKFKIEVRIEAIQSFSEPTHLFSE